MGMTRTPPPPRPTSAPNQHPPRQGGVLPQWRTGLRRPPRPPHGPTGAPHDGPRTAMHVAAHGKRTANAQKKQGGRHGGRTANPPLPHRNYRAGDPTWKRGGVRTTWNGPTSALRGDLARCARKRSGGRGYKRCGSESARAHKGHAARTKRTTGPRARNAQTTWNGVPAGKGTGHPNRTTRHTHHEGREGQTEIRGRWG